MQEEADKLKNLTSDNSRTKVVALGIGDEIRLNELNRIVSEPADRNVIQVYNFTSLHDVEDQMVDAICSGWYSFVSVRGGGGKRGTGKRRTGKHGNIICIGTKT